MDVAVKQARDLHKKHDAATLQYSNITALVGLKDPMWGWINDVPAMLSPLENAHTALGKVVQADPFMLQFMNRDIKQLRKELGAEQLQTACNNMVLKLKGVLTKFRQELDTITRVAEAKAAKSTK